MYFRAKSQIIAVVLLIVIFPAAVFATPGDDQELADYKIRLKQWKRVYSDYFWCHNQLPRNPNCNDPGAMPAKPLTCDQIGRGEFEDRLDHQYTYAFVQNRSHALSAILDWQKGRRGTNSDEKIEVEH